MNFPYVYRIVRPDYIYASGKSHDDKHRGLLKHGPFQTTPISEPKCLFVFLEHDREHSRKLYLALRNGVASYPGCKRLVGLNIDRENVEALPVPVSGATQHARRLQEALEGRLSAVDDQPDFAFVVHSKQPRPDEPDPYGAAKAVLTKYGIPSQFVSRELLDADNMFRYAITNIALSCFVKLGGIPWSVGMVARTPSLVVGVGRAEVVSRTDNTKRRLIGFAVCVLSNGLYLNTQFFPPAETYGEYLDNLENGLRGALLQMIGTDQEFQRATIHVSYQERQDAIRRVRDTIKSIYDTTNQAPIPFELLRLNEDSDFRVIDLSHAGYVSAEGTVVALEETRALLVTEGRNEKAIWRGRKPVTLEVSRQYASNEALLLRDGVEDAFRLSSVNWRGFNAVTQPISLQYAKLLAEEIAKMAEVDPNICTCIEQRPDFNSRPWFI